MNKDKDLLTHAMHEIRSLRRANEILSAKVSVVEVFAACGGLRGSGGCMSPDVAWEIEQRLQQIVAEEEKLLKEAKNPHEPMRRPGKTPLVGIDVTAAQEANVF